MNYSDEFKKQVESFRHGFNELINAIKEQNGIYDIRKSFSELIDYLPQVSGIFTETAKKFSSALKEITEVYRELFPLQEKLHDKSVTAGWVVPSELDTSRRNVQYLLSLNSDELNKYYLRLYTRRNFEILFIDLELLKDNLNDDYKPLVEIMIKTLRNDINTYPLMVTNLFSLLDYMFVYQSENGDLRTTKILSEKNVKKYIKNHPTGAYSYIGLFYVSCFRLIKKHIDYKSFEDEQVFNRHFIQHGRYSPSKLKLSDFIRLVNLCASFSFINSFNSDDDNN